MNSLAWIYDLYASIERGRNVLFFTFRLHLFFLWSVFLARKGGSLDILRLIPGLVENIAGQQKILWHWWTDLWPKYWVPKGLEMSGIFQDKSRIVWKFLEISVFRGGTFLSGFVKIFDTVPLPQLLIWTFGIEHWNSIVPQPCWKYSIKKN